LRGLFIALRRQGGRRRPVEHRHVQAAPHRSL
jgi:hypothetical protein